jgi:CheY-like chemotaxis protein
MEPASDASTSRASSWDHAQSPSGTPGGCTARRLTSTVSCRGNVMADVEKVARLTQRRSSAAIKDGIAAATRRNYRIMPRDRTILLVEDDTDLRRMFRTVLAFSGYRVLEAGDVIHALTVMELETLDLVILDLGLPRVSGYLVHQELASLPAAQRIPVLVVTAQPGPYDGIDEKGVLQKPVTPEQLIDAVEACLRSAPRE